MKDHYQLLILIMHLEKLQRFLILHTTNDQLEHHDMDKKYNEPEPLSALFQSKLFHQELNLLQIEFEPINNTMISFMGNNKSKLDIRLANNQFSDATRLVWSNHLFIHKIMDCFETFEEIAIIPRICRGTSDSLFSYPFKDRERQTCDWISFLAISRVYYDKFRNSKKWFNTKKKKELNRKNNYDRLSKLNFHALMANLDYISLNNIQVIRSCKKLILKDFKLSQLRNISKLKVDFAVTELTLQSGNLKFDQTNDDFNWAGNLFPNVEKVMLVGCYLKATFQTAKLMSKLPKLNSLTIKCPVSSSLFCYLPCSLTELSITIHEPFANVDLRQLCSLKKLALHSESLVQHLILIPERAESLYISCSMWHKEQTIPRSVKLFESKCYCPYHSEADFTMREAIERSSIQELILSEFSLAWWLRFQAPPSIRTIKYSNTECKKKTNHYILVCNLEI